MRNFIVCNTAFSRGPPVFSFTTFVDTTSQFIGKSSIMYHEAAAAAILIGAMLNSAKHYDCVFVDRVQCS